MEELALLWSALEPVKELLIAAAVAMVCLALWLAWEIRDWRRVRQMERALDVQRRAEEREMVLSPLPAFHQLPKDCPWPRETGEAHFGRVRP